MALHQIHAGASSPMSSPLCSLAAFVSVVSSFPAPINHAFANRNACFHTSTVAVPSRKPRVSPYRDETYMTASIPNNDPSDPVLPIEVQIQIETVAKAKTQAQVPPTIHGQLLHLNQRKQTSKYFRVREAKWQDLRPAGRICAESFSNAPKSTTNSTDISKHEDLSKENHKPMVLPLTLALPETLNKAAWDRFVLECVTLEIYIGFAIRFLLRQFTTHRIFIAETCNEEEEGHSGNGDKVGENKRTMVGVLELSVLQPDNALYPNPKYNAAVRRRRQRKNPTISAGSQTQEDTHNNGVAQVAEDIVPLSNETPFVYIQNVAVDSGFRRKGVAQLLMNYCERVVLYQLNKKAVYLHFELGNEAAQKLYLSLGYQVLGKDGHSFASTFRLARRIFAGKLLV